MHAYIDIHPAGWLKSMGVMFDIDISQRNSKKECLVLLFLLKVSHVI